MLTNFVVYILLYNKKDIMYKVYKKTNLYAVIHNIKICIYAYQFCCLYTFILSKKVYKEAISRPIDFLKKWVRLAKKLVMIKV